ncbi:MAG: DOMON-like domain-containing protein [Rhodocyclaceae bacterium]|uniref:DOMON-like domain-containing protein n=1 Tax=Sulfuricystis thermophila TaxID=2496847 RepID=UPI001036EEA3|nr:DOMON-like domain-containing protein [Sulfuricystis thermophila]MDI6748606.1 DOMON-like domain-containing protein [Rhodocyclaceae bacterium]
MSQAIHATLAAHPDNPQGFVQRVGVTVLQKDDGTLKLAYTIHCPAGLMRVPTREAPAPAGALWQTTCCELFVAADSDCAYREFNFSPSGQWAAYDFAAYREPLKPGAPIPAPLLWSHYRDGSLRLDASLSPSALPAGRHLRCALAVVVERHDGRLGYWALAHPAGPPDFHHPTSFLLAFPRPR